MMDENKGTPGADEERQPDLAPPPVVNLEPVRLTEFGPFPPRPELPEQVEGGERAALVGARKAPGNARSANGSRDDTPTDSRETAIALRISERERKIIDALTKLAFDDGAIQAPTISDYIRWLVERHNREALGAIMARRNV